MTAATDLGDDVWSIRRVVAWASDDLKKRGISSPRLEVELLLGRVLKLDRVGLLVDSERPLTREELGSYRALHQRRRTGEPVAYLLGAREFYGRMFHVDRRVLIPRPDTETLVDVALERTAHRSLSARVLDLCTGSGCVALTLACERRTTTVVGADISPDALTVARQNGLRLGAVNARFVASDLFAAMIAVGARFDLITANPPYILDGDVAGLTADIRDFEPKLALVGGADGLDLVRAIVKNAWRCLAPKGTLALEIGAEQSEATKALFEKAGYQAIETRRDYGGHERVVSGVAPR